MPSIVRGSSSPESEEEELIKSQGRDEIDRSEADGLRGRENGVGQSHDEIPATSNETAKQTKNSGGV